MSETLTALAAAAPLAAGWSLHGLRMRRRIEAARRDPLSGLLTREAFTERAQRRFGFRPGAVYLLDLNRFKEINDTLGHAAGDAVIRATGERLSGWATDCSAVVGRLGGDEFAAVAPVYSPDHLTQTLDRLTSALVEPIEAEGRALTVGVSVGAVAYGRATDPADLSALLRLADERMYAAKRSGVPWLTALDLTPTNETVNGRRAGRSGTHGTTEATS
ncbi:GGDEF domain-containing protein [Streptomyces scopuliridis]